MNKSRLNSELRVANYFYRKVAGQLKEEEVDKDMEAAGNLVLAIIHISKFFDKRENDSANGFTPSEKAERFWAATLKPLRDKCFAHSEGAKNIESIIDEAIKNDTSFWKDFVEVHNEFNEKLKSTL